MSDIKCGELVIGRVAARAGNAHRRTNPRAHHDGAKLVKRRAGTSHQGIKLQW